MREDIEKVIDYLSRHIKRLNQDIKKASVEKRSADEQYYRGAQNASGMFLGVLNDVIVKHNGVQPKLCKCGQGHRCKEQNSES